MRCDDTKYYVVKFHNNPQHRRILVNEMLATRLAARLGLCVPQVDVVDVRPELIAYSSDLVMQLGRGHVPCSSGKQFASQFPGHPARMTVHDVLPHEMISNVRNQSDFLGIFVFDKWTCNTDRRQAVFFRKPEIHASDGTDRLQQGQYAALMIDQGGCFNAGEWNFPDAPLLGIYENRTMYRGVTGMAVFEPWIERLEQEITEIVLREIALCIPSEWFANDEAELERLLDRLHSRRTRVRELIETAHRSDRSPFANWKVHHYYPCIR